jgi:hypothetical protein
MARALEIPTATSYVPSLTETYTEKPRSTRLAHSDERHLSPTVGPLGVATANAGRSAPLPLFFEQWGRFRSTSRPRSGSPTPLHHNVQVVVEGDSYRMKDERDRRQPGLIKKEPIPRGVDHLALARLRTVRRHHTQFGGNSQRTPAAHSLANAGLHRD